MLLCVNLDFSHLPFNPKEFHKKIRMVAVFQWNADPLYSFMWHYTACQDWGGEWPQPWKGSLCLWRKLVSYSVCVSWVVISGSLLIFVVDKFLVLDCSLRLGSDFCGFGRFFEIRQFSYYYQQDDSLLLPISVAYSSFISGVNQRKV